MIDTIYLGINKMMLKLWYFRGITNNQSENKRSSSYNSFGKYFNINYLLVEC